LAEFEKDDDWEEVIRKPSPRNPEQKKSQVRIKRRQKGDEVFLLCVSEGREAKDRAIREKQEQQLKEDLEALQTQVGKRALKKNREDPRGNGPAQGALPASGPLLPDRV